MTLPYDMGNAGDLLKHGVLAEFVRWQCELGMTLRFLDPFGGEPWGRPVPEVARRVRALPGCALRTAQTGIDDGRYYGSDLLVRRTADAVGKGHVRVLSGDACTARRNRLRACSLWMLDDVFPGTAPDSGCNRHDGYDALGRIICAAREGDLLLVDPFFDDFLERRARTVVPRMAAMAERAAVLLFVLHRNPRSRVSQRFDLLLEHHLRGAWRMTCPPLVDTGVRGESRYHAEIVLAARLLQERKRVREVSILSRRLTAFARDAARVLRLPAKQLEPRLVGH
ncbi:MAG: hypothetical protein F4X11_09610 [Acidobacteria bacterium]|nr:hypothetical protein [Acidobacteriota bacterium]